MDGEQDLVAQLSRQDATGDSHSARLLGMVVALAGEVFVLKAQVERLTRALEAGGAVDATALARAGDEPSMQQWMTAEERAFTRGVLRPWAEPDLARNVAERMLEDRA